MRGSILLYVVKLGFALVFFNLNQGLAQTGMSDYHINGFAQGTTYHITYYATDSVVTKTNIDSILNKIDSSLSIYKPYSLISRFNNSATGVEMDEHLQVIVKKSLEIFKETGGISDITVYPIVNAWGFGPAHPSAYPDSIEIQTLLRCVGSEKIHIRGSQLVKDMPCVKIDVNGIAQGYSVDVVANYMESRSVKNYVVEIGGELRIKGRKQPGGELMQIGIEGPPANSFDEPVIKKIVQIGEGAITTSGNYRKYAESGKRKISHLMDPKTGYPIQNELISVTVRAADAITADGYDNALMGMGLKNALIFLNRHKEMGAYFIYHKPDGSVADMATANFGVLK